MRAPIACGNGRWHHGHCGLGVAQRITELMAEGLNMAGFDTSSGSRRRDEPSRRSFASSDDHTLYLTGVS